MRHSLYLFAFMWLA